MLVLSTVFITNKPYKQTELNLKNNFPTEGTVLCQIVCRFRCKLLTIENEKWSFACWYMNLSERLDTSSHYILWLLKTLLCTIHLLGGGFWLVTARELRWFQVKDLSSHDLAHLTPPFLPFISPPRLHVLPFWSFRQTLTRWKSPSNLSLILPFIPCPAPPSWPISYNSQLPKSALLQPYIA